jgi:CheY-like chemotaxis protein
MKGREVTILVVDDDDGDAKMVQRAFKKASVANPMMRAVDGLGALDFLRGTNGKPRIRAPYILLVDINMPRMNGFDFVRALRADAKLKPSIVLMLTTSKHDKDKYAAYELNVAGYIVKENAGQDFLELVNLIGGFTRIVEMP